jgi:transposase
MSKPATCWISKPRHWPRACRTQTRRSGGGEEGSQRHLLVDGRGVPLSLVVTGANVHDVTQLEAVLASCMTKRPTPRQRRSKHLCADAGYRGRNAMKIIHGPWRHRACGQPQKRGAEQAA